MIVDGKAWLFRPWQSVVAAVRGSGFGGGSGHRSKINRF